ncbi:Histone transcription regulator 3 [Rhizina undulata]
MSSFTALNVYPDSDSEGEVDHTQEIQIEEALKLYQKALKLHHDGEWAEAHKAYDELFKSAIFLADADEELQVHGRNTAAASSLPLVFYLAYTNHGAFKLELLKGQQSLKPDNIRPVVQQALDWFATALGRDAGDPSLWRKAAQLALVMDSPRVTRFCLESIRDHETVGADCAHDTLSLLSGAISSPEEYFASLQLQDLLQKIVDTTALSHSKFQKLGKKKLNPAFAKYLNPYPWLPLPLPEEKKSLSAVFESITERKHVLEINSRSWPAVGKAILSRISASNSTETDPSTSSAIQIVIPTFEGEEESRDTTPDQPTPEIKSETAIADDGEDVSMADATTAEPPPETAATTPNGRRGSGNRKRKSTSIGIDPATDAGRSRLSKRQRDKKEADAAAAAAAAAATPESKKSKVRMETQDEKLFNTAEECFGPLGISFGTASSLKIKSTNVSSTSSLNGNGNGNIGDGIETDSEKEDMYLQDFKKILKDWDDDKGNVILYGDGIQPPDEAAQGMAFLDLESNVPNRPVLAGDEGLRRWVRGVNSRGLTPEEAGLEWIKSLCLRDIPLPKPSKRKPPLAAGGASSWMRHTWPEPLRDIVASMAGECEEILWKYFNLYEETLGEQIRDKGWSAFTEADYAVIDWAETMLEIYLGDLASQERARTGVEFTIEFEERLTLKKERVRRWSYLLGDLMNCRPRDEENQLCEDQLTLRYLWASAVITGYTDASREFRLECFENLRVLLEEGRHSIIELPNCPVMSEISAARAGREISKLKTVDFFTTVFKATNELGAVGSKQVQQQASDVIEFLEAVLEPDAVLPYDEEEGRILGEIGRFLEGSSAMFRLHLWEKLKTAYEKVSDPPKILSCMIRSLEVVITDLRSKSYIDASEDHRHFVLLRALRLTEDMLKNILNMMLFESETIVQGLEVPSIISGMKAMSALLRMLHAYAFWEDTVVNTEVKASDLHSYRLVVVKFRYMVVKGWLVMYLLYREVIRRGMGAPGGREWEKGEKETRLAGLLKDLHDELGVRSYCKLENHLFLKVMFEELMRFNLRQFDNELLQCIHCRFHLTISQNDSFSLYEHKTDPQPLDRASAAKLIEFLLLLASRKKIMQLQKSDVKTALDKIIEVIGFPRKTGNYRLQHNDAVIDQYLKSSINPLRLFDALKGRESISMSLVSGEYAMIAATGLYFMQGKIALFPLKYHSKKVGAVKQEEVEAAIRFLKADLVCRPDRWEGWYRLAQSYEFQMEDGMTWNAEGINGRRGELMTLERKSILCYMLAVSFALQYNANYDDSEVRRTIACLYTDFGYRMYSAARPPLSMDSFCMRGFDRHFSGTKGEGMYKAEAHGGVRYTMAIKAAKVLFERSLNISEEVNWKNYYMIGKCMGKLFNAPRIENENKVMYQPEEILEKYVLAVRHCPDKAGNDHIFEPHYKLVSATCKFVLQGLLEPKRACEILDATHFTKRMEHVEDRDSFVNYVLEVLKKLKSADKPKWHHRMTYRAARLKYEELNDVAGARADLSSLFSNKAAQLSIWRPENERPGRHFVFAFEYTTFYINMLEQLEDSATLDVLAKRVRKGANQFFKHTEIWTTLFVAYIKVLRSTGKVPEQFDEEVFKNVSYDEFNTYSQRLDIYCNLKEVTSPTHDLLQEVFELRRLNAGLAKTPLIDELLADTYAKLYSELIPEILKKLTQESEDRANPMSLKNVLFDEQATDPAASTAVSLAAAHSKLDDLPIRGKMTKVTRRELVSKASALCKVAAPKGSNSPRLKPTSTGTSANATRGGSVASDEDTPMGSPGLGAREDESDDEMQSDSEILALSALPGISIERPESVDEIS